MKKLSTAAAILGNKGGSSKSEAKQSAARENGKKGGRPQEYYTITCQKMGNTPETQDDAEIYEVFRVRATSHTQHWPYSTFLNGLAPADLDKINSFRAKGYEVTTTVGRSSVGIENK